MLYANALNGRADATNVASFTPRLRREFASRVARVPEDVSLEELPARQREAVVDLAHFGFKGFWGPKTTKLASLYRPHAVPVLDRQLARAFGLPPNAFSVAAGPRRANIARVVHSLADWLAEEQNRTLIRGLRQSVQEDTASAVHLTPVRVLDIVLWTTQDDRSSRRRGKVTQWVDMQAGPPIHADAYRAIAVADKHPT